MWSQIPLFILLLCSAVLAQNPPSSSALVDNQFVHQQFGDSCSLEAEWPPVKGDLNGDGIEDIVMVARCKNPLIDQGEKNYQVVDPMDSFYGYGNPRVTASMGQDDPHLKGICVLVVHGSGPDAWRSDTPLSKYVIINLAIKSITVKKMKVSKKKSMSAIYIEEATGDQMTSAIFWNGRKYRYEPLGSSME
ncbi:MAG: hypothetical protein JO356_04185 [Acidobacteria bacterium]|nr:hypothetical protein [Acidobacteriota bacterium]